MWQFEQASEAAMEHLPSALQIASDPIDDITAASRLDEILAEFDFAQGISGAAAFTRDLDAVINDTGLQPSLTFDEAIWTGADTKGPSDANAALSPQSGTSAAQASALADEETNHAANDLLESHFDPQMEDLEFSSPYFGDTETPQSFEKQFRSASSLESHLSNSPSHFSPREDAASTSPPMPATYETVTDYHNGDTKPDWWLSCHRRAVDADFSNENWGDEYYFSQFRAFRYIEDFSKERHKSLSKRTDTQAICDGLDRIAFAIPLRQPEEGWKSFERLFHRLGCEEGDEQKLPSTAEEMQQRIKASIEAVRVQPLPRDLDPTIQRHKVWRGRKAIKRSKMVIPRAPDMNPLRFETAPCIVQRAGTQSRAVRMMINKDVLMQRRLRELEKMADGRLRASRLPEQV